MIDRHEIARILREIGQLLQLKGENVFKTRAYDTAALRLDDLEDDLAAMVRESRLREIPGIGEAIAAKITELVQTGAMQYYEKLKDEFPPGILELLTLPDLGPKKAAALFGGLGVSSLAALEEACRAGKVRGLKGFSEKTEKKLLDAIEARKASSASGMRHPLASVWTLAQELRDYVRRAPGVVRAELGGSARRLRETVADLDVIASGEPADVPAIMEHFVRHPRVLRIIARGDTKCSVFLTPDNLQVDLRVVPDLSFATALHHFTGSKAHHVRLRGLAHGRGMKISEYALEQETTRLPVSTEADLYAHLGMQFVPPELREDRGEVEAALAGTLPAVVALEQVRGQVHCHSTWSDGVNSLLEMAREAAAMGMKFMTCTDHSRTASYAGGLSIDDLKRQWDEIDRVQEQVPQIKLFKGSEVDILEDGALDYPDEILAKLDVVIASVHSRFKMEEDAMTARIARALENPLVCLWGHPTGRLIGKRDPYAVRMEEILDLCAQKRVVVECNGNPNRLDLSSDHVRLAVERGVRLSVSTDAHSTGELHNLHFSVGTARRGWARPELVVNTFEPAQFLAALHERR